MSLDVTQIFTKMSALISPTSTSGIYLLTTVVYNYIATLSNQNTNGALTHADCSFLCKLLLLNKNKHCFNKKKLLHNHLISS